MLNPQTTSLLIVLIALTGCDGAPDPITTSDAGSAAVPDAGSTAAPDAGPPEAVLDTPESALWDATRDLWYVSNIAGDSSEVDGVGWISTLDADGRALNARWVQGLDAPKGMALIGSSLYVADITTIVEIDVSSAEIRRRIVAPGAIFLNDLASADGTVYASDTFAGAIYELRPGASEAQVLVADPALASVNGIVVRGDRIVAGTIGDFADPTDLGDLLEVPRNGGPLSVITSGIGKIDGLEVDGARLLATDFLGTLFAIDASGARTDLQDVTALGLGSAADLGFDPSTRRVMIPDIFTSQVVIVDVP